MINDQLLKAELQSTVRNSPQAAVLPKSKRKKLDQWLCLPSMHCIPLHQQIMDFPSGFSQGDKVQQTKEDGPNRTLHEREREGDNCMPEDMPVEDVTRY